MKESSGKPVLQIEKRTGKIIGYYDSVAEASEKTGIDRAAIQCVCNLNETAGDFKWEWAKYRYSCKWGKWWISGEI